MLIRLLPTRESATDFALCSPYAALCTAGRDPMRPGRKAAVGNYPDKHGNNIIIGISCIWSRPRESTSECLVEMRRSFSENQEMVPTSSNPESRPVKGMRTANALLRELGQGGPGKRDYR